MTNPYRTGAPRNLLFSPEVAAQSEIFNATILVHSVKLLIVNVLEDFHGTAVQRF